MITVAGEALIDLVDEGGGRYRAHPGGGPANVAVGLARLGVPCSMLARVSADALGDQLMSHLAGNGVSLRDVVRAAEPTTLALASLDEAGQAAYSFYVQGTADWQWRRGELPDVLPPDVSALHTGSLALALSPGARAVEDLLAAERARGRVTISIDPNIRPRLAARRADEAARVERQIRLAHIVKASEDDTGWLYPGAGCEAVARAWQRLGPALVVITLGARGAYALAPDGTEVRRPARPVRIADTVGAGDAFCAGLLDALWRRSLLGVDSGRPATLDAPGAAKAPGSSGPAKTPGNSGPAKTPGNSGAAKTPGSPGAASTRGAPGGEPAAIYASATAEESDDASPDAGTALARISVRDISEVVDWAVLVAALACERPGSDPPTRQEALQAG